MMLFRFLNSEGPLVIGMWKVFEFRESSKNMLQINNSKYCKEETVQLVWTIQMTATFVALNKIQNTGNDNILKTTSLLKFEMNDIANQLIYQYGFPRSI